MFISYPFMCYKAKYNRILVFLTHFKGDFRPFTRKQPYYHIALQQILITFYFVFRFLLSYYHRVEMLSIMLVCANFSKTNEDI